MMMMMMSIQQNGWFSNTWELIFEKHVQIYYLPHDQDRKIKWKYRRINAPGRKTSSHWVISTSIAIEERVCPRQKTHLISPKNFWMKLFSKKTSFDERCSIWELIAFQNKRWLGMQYCPLPGFFLVTGPGVVVLSRRWNPGRKAWFYISHWLINKLLANFFVFLKRNILKNPFFHHFPWVFIHQKVVLLFWIVAGQIALNKAMKNLIDLERLSPIFGVNTCLRKDHWSTHQPPKITYPELPEIRVR